MVLFAVRMLAGAVTLSMTACVNSLGYTVVGSGSKYTNHVGGPQTVGLPDGSHVLLMDGTTVSVAEGYGKEGREVEIDGEGVFLVRASVADTSDTSGALGTSGTQGDTKGMSFVVHTGNLVIDVLDSAGPDVSGAATSRPGYQAVFAVSAVRKQAGEETDVLQGRIRVTKAYHSDTDSLPEELMAGEMAMINREIDLMEKEKMSGADEEKVKAKYNLAPF
jgi:ferric-dicitrate binding protein FerR (iron transport regulator)